MKVEISNIGAFTKPLAGRLAEYEPVAKLIFGKHPPSEWLLEHLCRWTPCLLMSRAIRAQQPTRAELIRNMKGMLSAAETLLRGIENVAMR